MARDLGSRERYDLFPDLFSLCMKAHAENSDASDWLRQIMTLLDGLPEPLVMHAVESELMRVSEECEKPQAYVELLEALRMRAITLSAQPQALLLLQLAFCIGQIHGASGEDMLEALVTQADALDLPQASKTAWKLLYRAAAWHHDKDRQRSQQRQRGIEQESLALPESLRRYVMPMLKAIDGAYRPRKHRLPDARGECAIL
jgi:hypothetical protein